MKKTTKLLSVVFALIFALSVFVIPSSAALSGDEDVTIRMQLDPVIGEVDAEGNKSEENGIYKLSIYLDSNVKVAGIGASILYDESVVTPLNPSEGQIYYQYVCDDEFRDIAYGVLGSLADTGRYGSTGNPVTSRPSYYGPSYSASYLNITTYRRSGGGELSFLYQAVAKTLIPGANGEEGIAYLYFKLNDGKTAADLEGAKFAIKDDMVRAIAVCENPECGKFFTNNTTVTDLPTFKTPDYVYTAPVAAGPVLTHAGRQVKMTVKDGAVVSGTEQMRVISSISQDDWTNYFNNDGSNIKRVGIVAYKGAGFDVDTAKAAAMGTANEAYTVQTTDYISTKTAGVYQFAARIEYQSDVFDTSYIAFVEYTDAENNTAYAFYDASYELQFKTNYTGITTYYMGQIGA